jgi:hypothetical protein
MCLSVSGRTSAPQTRGLGAETITDACATNDVTVRPSSCCTDLDLGIPQNVSTPPRASSDDAWRLKTHSTTIDLFSGRLLSREVGRARPKEALSEDCYVATWVFQSPKVKTYCPLGLYRAIAQVLRCRRDVLVNRLRW